jgi:hypothetical protein
MRGPSRAGDDDPVFLVCGFREGIEPVRRRSSISAACCMVAQSDWLPMMMAIGFFLDDGFGRAAIVAIP